MTTRAWLVARKARTLLEAHAALVVVRPVPEADRSVWVSYYLRSAEIYAEVAELDPGHRGHATYWADREKAKADRLIGQTDASTKSSGRRSKRQPKDGPAVTATSLDLAHSALSKIRPSTAAPPADWADFYRHAAVMFADVAEVDRLHHHEALFYAGLARRRATHLTGQTQNSADAESPSDSVHL